MDAAIGRGRYGDDSWEKLTVLIRDSVVFGGLRLCVAPLVEVLLLLLNHLQLLPQRHDSIPGRLLWVASPTEIVHKRRHHAVVLVGGVCNKLLSSVPARYGVLLVALEPMY